MQLRKENVFVTCLQTCFSRVMVPEVGGLCGSGPSVASDSPSCSVEQRSFPSGFPVLNFTVITASITAVCSFTVITASNTAVLLSLTASITAVLLSLLLATQQFYCH